MKYFILFLSLFLLPLHAGNTSKVDSLAQDSCFCGRPDALAPIGIMGDHLHRKGRFMASARTMFMRMEQNYIGNHSVTDLQVQSAGFMIVPNDMDMQMNMFGVMYGLTDKITLMAMINHLNISMNHSFGMNLPEENTFTTRSSGWGDASLSVLTELWYDQDSVLTSSLALLLPTAQLREADLVPPAGGIRRLPYPMQLGHGSWGLAPSLTFTSHRESWSCGLQTKARLLLKDNSEGYRLGNRVEASTWIAAPLTENLAASLRLTYLGWGNIDGADPLVMGPVPTARPDLRGGSRIDAFAGLSYIFPAPHARLGLEVGKSLSQNLDGPQLGNDYSLQLGWQYSW